MQMTEFLFLTKGQEEYHFEDVGQEVCLLCFGLRAKRMLFFKLKGTQDADTLEIVCLVGKLVNFSVFFFFLREIYMKCVWHRYFFRHNPF